MEQHTPRWVSYLGNAVTAVTLLGGGIALWDKFNSTRARPDLSGRWTITNTVISSAGGHYDGDVYVYSVGVTESADHHLSGTGEQTLYNHQAAKSRFPITISDGKHTDEQVKVNFTVQGNREFTGTLWLKRDEEDPARLSGTFEHTAGGTQGITEVRIR